jgi:DNA polymerase-3 subunit gamma/tau
MSLYLKYRPKDFDNLIGQDHIKTTLLNALQKQKLSHAYLFCGPRGTGKTTTARLIAKAINCQKPLEQGQPCNECEICIAAMNENLIDLIEIDAASNRGIDEIRDLRDKIRFSPNQAKAKVYIIDEVHMLTKEAFNALLKTLEEPPAHAYFILATTETHKVPATIISRCQKFDFRRISINDLVSRLKHIAEHEKIDYEIEALSEIAKIVKGGLRDAISIFDQLSHEGKISLEKVKKVLGLSSVKAVEDFFEALMHDQSEEAISIIDQIYKQGIDLLEFTRELLELVREKMIEIIKGKLNLDLNKILKIIDKFTEARIKINSSVIPQMPLEIAIIEVCSNHKIAKIPAIEKTENEKNSVKKEEDKTEENKSINISTKTENPFNIKEKWQEIIQLFTPIAVRQSLKQAKVEEKDTDELNIIFDSKFHHDNFNKTENIFNIEKIIKEKFDALKKVNCMFIEKKDDENVTNAIKFFSEGW